MEILLHRQKANYLYTEGELTVNGKPFCHTVEHTFTMLPVGEYQVKLANLDNSSRCLWIVPLPSANLPPSIFRYTIASGNSWKEAKANHSILIGTPLIPGALIRSSYYFNRLFERIEKTKKQVILRIRNTYCNENSPAIHWL